MIQTADPSLQSTSAIGRIICCLAALGHRTQPSILPFDMEAAEQMIASRHKKTQSPTTNVLRVELGRAQSLEIVLADMGQILASK